jgi:Hint domain
MNSLVSPRTRRHLFRLTAAAATSIPLIGLAGSAGAKEECDDDECKKGGACFLNGTRISTPLGERLVQDLTIGDEVVTLNGVKSVRWIGRNKYKKEPGKDWIEGVKPIRVARFAIDDRTPHRDLYLSPAHCVFIDGVLIPVEYLINDVSIVPCAPPDLDLIEYFHIEFETHEVIHAEGMPVESYYGANRESFSNFVEHERVYGAEPSSAKVPFAPIWGYHGGRAEAKALIRSLVSRLADVRDPIQVAWERIFDRTKYRQFSGRLLRPRNFNLTRVGN